MVWVKLFPLVDKINKMESHGEWSQLIPLCNEALPLAREHESHDKNKDYQLYLFQTQGLAYCKLEKYQEAIEVFEKHASLWVTSGKGGYDLNIPMHYPLSLHRAGRYDDALQLYSRYVAVSGHNYSATFVYLLQGKILFELKKYEQALDNFKEAYFQEKFESGAYGFGGRQTPYLDYPYFARTDGYINEAIYYQGLALSKLKRYNEALQKLDLAVQAEPKEPRYLICKADILLKLERFQGAIDCCNMALSSCSDNAEVHYTKGKALQSLGKMKEAMESYTSATKLKSDYGEAFLAKGQILEKQGKLDDALLYYDEAITIQPGLVDTYFIKADLLTKMQDFNEAIKCYDEAIKVQPGHVETYLIKADLLTKMQDFNEAIKCYDLILRQNPSHLAAWHKKGMVLQALAKYTGAIDCFNKALQLDPNYAICHCDKGRILNDLGQFREALECFNKAYKIIKLEKISSNVTAEQLNEINEILNQDREALLEKLGEVAKINLIGAQHLSPGLQGKIKSVNKARHDLLENAANFVDPSRPAFKRSGTGDLQKQIEQLKDEMFEIKREIQSQRKKINNQQDLLEKARIYEKAEIRQDFQDLENTDPKLNRYCKAFYWTLMNYFAAYRSLSTGLIQGKIETSMKNQLLQEGVKKAFEIGTELVKGIPFVGGLIGALDKIIDTISGHVKETNFSNKVNTINKIIMFGKDATIIMEEDVSITAARLAVELTKTKKGDILQPDATNTSWLKKKIQEINTTFFKAVELYETNEAQLALEDVVVLLSYICKNAATLREEPLEQQFKLIVINGELTKLANGANLQLVTVASKQDSCCSIF